MLKVKYVITYLFQIPPSSRMFSPPNLYVNICQNLRFGLELDKSLSLKLTFIKLPKESF